MPLAGIVMNRPGEWPPRRYLLNPLVHARRQANPRTRPARGAGLLRKTHPRDRAKQKTKRDHAPMRSLPGTRPEWRIPGTLALGAEKTWDELR